MQGDIQYRNRRDARGKFLQQGTQNLSESMRRPIRARLRLFERMAAQDLTIKSGLHVLVSSIVSSIGNITHPDPEISTFLSNVIETYEQVHGKGWKDSLYQILRTTLWSGFSVTETMWDLQFGSLTLDDLQTYHPSGLTLHPDKAGKLTDGQETLDGYHKSGIYQSVYSAYGAEKRLDSWKCLYLANEADYGNLYGNSLIAPSYKWSRLKEAVIDMMASSLENTGKRLLFVVSPSYILPDEIRPDSATGEDRPLTTVQFIKEQFESSEDLGSALVIPKQNPDVDIEVGSLSLSDGFGSTFINHLAYLDEESVKHILPYFLISDHAVRLPNQERRMEVHYNTVDQYRDDLVRSLVRKIFVPLITWNFNREAAKLPPTFTRVYSDRPEDRVATMQMVKGLTEEGYLNPTEPQDWSMVRQMVRLAERPQTPQDLKFIREIMINPRQKTPRSSDVGPNGSGSPGKPTGTKMPNQEPREPKAKLTSN
jgi:hypothetical protein